MTMGIRRRSVIYYLVLLVCCRVTEAHIKEWNPPPNSDWQNGNNWDGGRPPCWRSRVILPEEVVISVFLNGTVAWSELIMPETGELVLEDLILNADDAKEPCSDDQVKFVNWKPSSWFNPDYWRIAESNGAVIQQPLAIPHSERIPCAHDSVHLSNRHSLSVDFSTVNELTVGQVKYGDQLLTAEEWRSQLNGQGWRYQVHNPPRSVNLNGTECQDSLGCFCGHNVDVQQMICSNAGTLCSNQLECADSFRPQGHCCDMCGAMLTLKVDERIFTKTSLDRLVSSLMVEDGSPGSQSYSYRTGNDVIQLLIVDNTTNQRSVRLASKTFDYLKKDRNSTNLYGIMELNMVISGLSYPATHHLSPEELQLIGSNVLTVFATLIVIGVVGAGIYFYGKQRLSDSVPSVGFARFQNDSAGNVEIAIDTSFERSLARPPLEHPSSTSEQPFTEAPDIPDTTSAADTCHENSSNVTAAWKKFTRAFTNPLFGDPSAARRMSARWTMSSLMKTAATQENPIYNIDVVAPVMSSSAVEVIAPVVPETATGNGAEEGVEEGNVPPQVDTFPAVDGATATAAAAAPETVMEDVVLESSDTIETKSEKSSSSDGAKHPLKKLWRKAAKKFTPADAIHPSTDAEQTADVAFTAQNQQREDEMQLTLAEETTDE